ncbi:ABC transporter permease [Dyella sp.]|uniref:ABC transporter permease n=1 Tax=Dyella sp. TaxID=1869338 RepID=UPI002ED591DE
MQIKPVLAALRRHRLATLLIAMEIALACAVLCNACFLIATRWAAMNQPSGVDESSLATIQLDAYEDRDAIDLNARLLAGLRAIPGVQSVTLLNSIPFGRHRGTAGIETRHDGVGTGDSPLVELYLGGPGSFDALGLRVVQGRKLNDDDYQPFNGLMPAHASVLVTRSLAERIWPGDNPLGKLIWLDESRYEVVGVMDQLVVPDPNGRGRGKEGWSVFVPGQSSTYLASSYLIKADPKDIARVERDAREAAGKLAPDAVLDQPSSRTISDLRQDYFHQDRVMTGVLIGVVLALLLVTVLGIVGLASFWVQQRRKQIGIRRAIGATRADILGYFQTENFLIVSLGIGMGMVLAFALNLLLMHYYEVPRLPWAYLPVGALVLWSLGQLAVLGPALRASQVPPVVATRSV